ncbi:MAG: sodium:calcium antiporter [Candidatus Thorarchaeota archaeon]
MTDERGKLTLQEDSLDEEAPHRLHSLRESLAISKKETLIVVVLLVFYVNSRFVLSDTVLTIMFGLIMGTWLAFRPSEWAVEGIESAAGHARMTTYMAGMLSSLASNMPEAVVSGFAAYAGYAQNNMDMLDIAVLSVLIAAGFNMLLLGLTIIISTKGKGAMEVPEEAIKKDSVLIRWTIVALSCMFALGMVDFVSQATPDPRFPPLGAFVLLLSYVMYAGALMGGERAEDSRIAVPRHSRSTALLLTLAGFVGIFFAGEVLTSSVEILLKEQHTVISQVADPVTIAAFILGAAGALPEHGIALMAAARGKVGLAVGNLVGGILQIVLLVMGGIGVFVPIPLDRYVLFQIVVIAGSLWFLKRAITDDHKLDLFEGAMIVLLQAYVFILLIWGPAV